MAVLEIQFFILAVILGTLLAIVYSLRVLILLERRVASMEMNIQKLTSKVLKKEEKDLIYFFFFTTFLTVFVFPADFLGVAALRFSSFRALTSFFRDLTVL